MNDQDKRAFLAFILSMLLFAAFYWWYSPVMKADQQRRQKLAMEQKRATDSLSAVQGSESAPQPSRSAELPGLPAGRVVGEARADTISAPLFAGREVPAKKVRIRSPLYEITLSSLGAEIVSARLLRYETDGLPVELLPARADSAGAGMASIELLSEGGRVPLSLTPFDVLLSSGGGELENGAVVVLDENNPQVEIRFVATDTLGHRLERFYSFEKGSYIVESGLRFHAGAFPSVKGVAWSMGSGLASTEKDRMDDYTNFQAALRLGEEIHRKKLTSFPKSGIERFSMGTVVWLALQTKYFTAAFVPEGSPAAEALFLGDRSTHFLSAAVELPAYEKSGVVEQNVDLYIGPLDFGILKSMGVGLEKNINMGYKFIRPVSWVILKAAIGLHKVIPNYGVVIILLSVFTKVLFYRLTHKSFKSMRDMQRLQPKIQALKEKYKDDKQKLSAETMKLYKEAGVNPLGGCLPMLLQAPVFIALFSVLKYTIELRQAGFVWWMDDLSRQDVLFLLPISLPLIGRAVSVLPILMGAAMLLQTKIGGSITGGTSGGATQPKAFSYMLPIVFTFIFYKMPSGLVLYWLVNNVLSIGQQYYINKDIREEKEKEKEKEKGKETEQAKVVHRKKKRKTATAKKVR